MQYVNCGRMSLVGVAVLAMFLTLASALPLVAADNVPAIKTANTPVEYALPTDARVTLDVYDVLGRRVAELVNGYVSAGYHSAEFNASALASGIYFYRLSADGGGGKPFTQMRKLI